jgi:hypothetical protein
MTDPNRDNKTQLESPTASEKALDPKVNRPAGEISDAEPSTSKPLSAAEQMARYEDALKEDDWGHQPC